MPVSFLLLMDSVMTRCSAAGCGKWRPDVSAFGRCAIRLTDFRIKRNPSWGRFRAAVRPALRLGSVEDMQMICFDHPLLRIVCNRLVPAFRCENPSFNAVKSIIGIFRPKRPHWKSTDVV